jgi:hypothetical protein
MYAYVLNNPMTNIDPTGQNCFDDSDTNYTFTGPYGVIVDDTCDFSDMLDFGVVYTLITQIKQTQAIERAKPIPVTIPRRLLAKVVAKVCSVIPQGQALSVGGALGALGAVGGSTNLVTDYNTGETTLSSTGSLGAGWNGAASGSISGGYIFSTSQFSNSGYSGTFYTASASSPAGPGGFVSTSGTTTVVGGSMGASLLPTATGGLSVSQTSGQIGSTWLTAILMSQSIVASSTLARMACNAHGN